MMHDLLILYCNCQLLSKINEIEIKYTKHYTTPTPHPPPHPTPNAANKLQTTPNALQYYINTP